jgi:hypothetical protein
MFVLVRYVGLSWAIFSALSSTTFISGPLELCTAVTFVNQWAFAIFLSAADSVMIVRVYAMWNRSKTILYLLLFIYVPQVIISIIFTAVFNTRTYLTVAIIQVMGFSSCNAGWKNVPFMLKVYQVIPRFILGAMLLILAVTQTLKQSVNMYKAKKEWQLNRYMERLVKDGILYFLVNVLLNITSILEAQDGSILSSTSLQFLTMFYVATLCSIMPRFIISVRELYNRDHRRGWQGVDTGFGMSSQPTASRNAALSAIAFADIAPGQDQVVEGDVNESEGIRLEPLGDNTHQV